MAPTDVKVKLFQDSNGHTHLLDYLGKPPRWRCWCTPVLAVFGIRCSERLLSEAGNIVTCSVCKSRIRQLEVFHGRQQVLPPVEGDEDQADS